MALIVKGKIKALNSNIFSNSANIIKTDILLLSMPLTVTNSAWAAGAVLKSIAVDVGHTCSTLDLNVITVQWLRRHIQSASLEKFFWEGILDHQCQSDIDTYIADVISCITQYDPKILGLSLFSDFSRPTALLIARAVRQFLPHVQIIVGGAGATNGAVHTLDKISFGQQMFDEGIVDHYIIGDAEHSFREFLKNNLAFPGINQDNWRPLDKADVSILPYPDYSDYDWSLYPYKAIGITGSRGCVRKCDFCNYISIWKDYIWRTADNIFEEMLYQKQRYGVSHFHFSDSLINGNMKEYRRLITLLADHNLKNPDDLFWWSSFFILRPNESDREDIWRLTAQSGCKSIAVGIESFDDATRAKMGKNFINTDIDFCIQMAIKYKIELAFLLFVGYVSDTEEIIDQAIQWLDNHQDWKEYFFLAFQQTMILMPGSWLDQNRNVVNIELLDPKNRQSWINTKTGSTFELREQWFARILAHCKKLNYHYSNESDMHKWLEDVLLGRTSQ
jgi:radical SAM superfamily enzyme YgiQ (UPF0313 family)